MLNNSKGLSFRRTVMITGLLNLMVVGWVLAQPPQESEPESKETPKPATQTNDDPPAQNGNSDGSFTPSEEISEDLSVSFPVDI